MVITTILSVIACRLSPVKEQVDGENSNGGFWRLISNLNSKGLAVLALAVVDFISFGKVKEVGELIGLCLGTFLFIVVFFYIIYGVMTLIKVAGEDTVARREKAFWISFGINALFSVMILMDA